MHDHLLGLWSCWNVCIIILYYADGDSNEQALVFVSLYCTHYWKGGDKGRHSLLTPSAFCSFPLSASSTFPTVLLMYFFSELMTKHAPFLDFLLSWLLSFFRPNVSPSLVALWGVCAMVSTFPAATFWELLPQIATKSPLIQSELSTAIATKAICTQRIRPTGLHSAPPPPHPSSSSPPPALSSSSPSPSPPPPPPSLLSFVCISSLKSSSHTLLWSTARLHYYRGVLCRYKPPWPRCCPWPDRRRLCLWRPHISTTFCWTAGSTLSVSFSRLFVLQFFLGIFLFS